MKADTKSFYQRAVRKAAERVVNGLDGAIDLESLAREAAMSPFHFHRVFRGMLGETPLELHRRLRLERAAWQLLSTEHGITSVAFDAGYETHEAFTRAFRAQYGTAPSEFRQRGAERVGGCAASPRSELAARCGIHFAPQGLPTITIKLIEGASDMRAEIVARPALRVATVHHVGPYQRISEAFGKLGTIAGQAGLLREGAAMIAIYHDDPETTPEAQLQSDAGITVADGAPIPTGLGELRIAGGRYATTTHRGPYATLGDTWARLMGEWLPRSGERLGAGVSYELYRNDPTNTPQAELLTELFIPLV